MPWPGLIVHKKCTVTVLQGGVGVQDGVVGLHDSCRDLKVVNFKKGCNHRKGFYCTILHITDKTYIGWGKYFYGFYFLVTF